MKNVNEQKYNDFIESEKILLSRLIEKIYNNQIKNKKIGSI